MVALWHLWALGTLEIATECIVMGGHGTIMDGKTKTLPHVQDTKKTTQNHLPLATNPLFNLFKHLSLCIPTVIHQEVPLVLAIGIHSHIPKAAISEDRNTTFP
jgi:hypothetical protein